MKDCYKSDNSSCPFSFTSQSEEVQNYGCLPSLFEIVNMRVIHGKTWSCHSNIKVPCSGALIHLKKNNLPYSVIDVSLLSESDNWSKYVK